MAVQPAVQARFLLTPVLALRSRYGPAGALEHKKKPGLAPVFLRCFGPLKGGLTAMIK